MTRARVIGAIGAGLVLGLGAAPAVAAPVSSGHSGWAWGSPTPQGQQLNAVAFAGATGYAVGDFGTVVKSIDGGATWTGLPSGTTNPLDVVQEVSPDVVVVGGSCSVRVSTDGGATFTSLPINPSESFCDTDVASFSFQDAQHGYVELQDGTMLFTDDGGQTVQAKTNAPVSGGKATQVLFPSASTGFAVASHGTSGGVIERTTDSAASWTQVGSSSHALNGITFVDSTHAFAVGDQGTLLGSTDAGATWSPLPLTLPAGSGPFNLAHISCSGPMTCLISTQDGKELIRTTDGGMTGTIVNPSNEQLFDVAFSTGSSVVGVGQLGATVLSTDGGATFATVESSNLQFSFDGPMRSGGVAGSAYVPGQHGRIAATTNGGATWTLLHVPTTSDTVDVAFPTPNQGYELEADGTFRSSANGGVSWSSVDTGVSRLGALAAPTAQTVLFVGLRGIHRSTDGGKSFAAVQGSVVLSKKTRKKPAKTIKVSKLRLSEAQTVGKTVIAWGGSGMFESTNGGSSWKLVPAPLPGAGLISVSLVNPSTAWVVTSSSRVFSTRNGGRTWTESPSVGALGRPDQISFSSVRDGLLSVSASGPSDTPFESVAMLATSDGGATWHPEVIDGDGEPLVLATPSADYALDPSLDQGTVPGLFETTDGGASPSKTSLRISLPSKRLTTKALAKAGHKVKISGKVTPVTSQSAQIALSYHSPGARWRSQLVKVVSSGAFTATIQGIRSTTDFVAQSVGDGVHGGGATPALTLTVGAPKKHKH
jgi:photosystem II stability/assembly factor-like uncharacterized protein